MGLFSDITGSKGRKEASRREDAARQEETSRNLLNELLAQLIPGSEEYTRLLTEGTDLVRRTGDPGDQAEMIRQLAMPIIAAQQQRVAAGGAATPLESRTDLATQRLRGLSDFQPYEQDVFDALTGGESSIDTDAGRVFREQVLRAKDPDASYTSTFQPALDLLQEQVKARAARRGILGSGLELEDLGRTGSELAIREGQAREGFRQGQYDRFANVYGQGQALRNRQLGLEGDLVNIQLGRESNLTGLLANAGYGRASDARDLAQRTTEQSIADRLDAMDAEAARKAALGQAIGTGVGFAVGGPTGASIGGSIGGNVVGKNPQAGGNVFDIFQSQRGQEDASPDLAATLRRTPGIGSMSAEEFARLLREAGH